RLQLEADDSSSHPLLVKRPIKTARIIIISADRGLAGGFNSNLARAVERFLIDEKERFPRIELAIVGRKAREHFKRRLGGSNSLYKAMLDSIASFFGAQMSAMDNATKNAKEMIGNLTLQFNRARQAAITKELMEIVGGAEALKG